MAKGFDAHKARLAEIQRLGKSLARNAGFQCEWCEGKDGLRVHDQAPARQPSEDTLLFLCERCRELAAGVKVEADTLRGLVNALWSERDVVKNTLAGLLVATGERWAREAVEQAWLDDDIKELLLGEE